MTRPAAALETAPPADELRAAAAMGLTWRAWVAQGRPTSEAASPRAKVKGRLLAYAPYRSKWERDYAMWLAVLAATGRVREWAYEPDRLEIGEGARYTPDFRVTWSDGGIEYHEVKGYRREAAMVRLKVAAKLYPQYRFLLVTKQRGEWITTPITRAGRAQEMSNG